MEIRNLHTFLQVASLQSFTQAAEALGYSQSNVSTQVAQLEKEVGAPLFNRIGHRISLTQYGEELLPYARQIVATALRMENFLKSPEAVGGTIHVGMVESLFNLLFEGVVTRYHSRFPLVKVDLTMDATETLKARVQQGLLDFACLIDEFLPPDQWHCWHSTQVPVVIIANPQNPLSDSESVSVEDLKNEDFILMEETAPYNVQFQREMAGRRLGVKTFLRLQSTGMARKLVQRENFCSVLPYYTVKAYAENGTVKILPVKDFTLNQFVQIVMHINKLVTPQIEGFLEDLKQDIQKKISRL